MSCDRVIETACWRIWYRLEQRGECTKTNLMSNCGIHSKVFTEAIDTLENIGVVEKSRCHREDGCYYKAVEKPRMMQVFPTIHNDEL